MPQHKFISIISISLLFIIITISSKAQTPTYEMYISNQLQIDTKTYQFDVFVLSTGTPVLEMANIQLGIGIDTSITNGGTLSFNMVSGSSQLLPSQVPQNFVVGGAFYNINAVVYRCLNQSQRTGPGAGNGTIISKIKTSCTSPGTRIGTYRLTNTRDFKISSLTKHIFNTAAGTQRVATAVSCYVNGLNTTAIGTLYNYNTNGTCDQNLVLNECSISTSVSTTPVIYYGESTGSATITLTGAGTSSTGTYKLDGGLPIAFSANPFVVNGLSAGMHNITITSGLCEANTGSFTIVGPALDPNLQRPPKPSSIKVTPLNNCSTKLYRFEVEEDLPASTHTSIFANGWQWEFRGYFTSFLVIDSGTMNSKKIVVKFLNNQNYSLLVGDTVKVCYTSLLGNSQYQTTRQFKIIQRKIPTPTHIVVNALASSQEGYRRFRYSAPDSILVVTDSTFQTTGWQWSFGGNLSQSMVIDSGNYNSKQIIVKLMSNDVENIDDSVKLAYLSNCGIGNYTATKFTRTSGHKYIFNNHIYDGGWDFYGNWFNGLSEMWDNPNNWDEYPGTHLVYGDTVIMNGFCYMNNPVILEFGSILIVEGSMYIQNTLTSNSKILLNLNGYIYLNPQSGNLLGNYFMELNGSFDAQSYTFTQPGTIFINSNAVYYMSFGSNTGTITNNGYLNFNMVNDNFGTIINNGYFDYYYYGSNYGTIINNANILDWWGDYGNINIYYNYGTIVNNRKSSSVFGCEVNESSGVIINNNQMNSNITLNKGEIINNDHLSIFSSNNNGKIINNKYLTLSDYNSTNGHIITNDSLIFNGTTVIYSDSLVLNNDVIINGAFYNSSKLVNYGNISLNENAYIFNSELMNEQDGKISGAGVIYCESNGINKGIINCFGIANWGFFINDNLGLIESIIDNTSIFENNGLINISNSQSLSNEFNFKNNGIINLSSGSFFSNNNYIFKNYGTINSSALFYEYNSTFENYGTLNNFSEHYPSHTVNYGVINNDSIINLFNDYQERTIDNYSIINNNGAIIGSGNINNIGGITINNGIVSPGSTRNASIDSLNNSTTSRSVVNTISPSNSNDAFKIGSLTFSDFIGTPTFEIEIADTSRITGHDFVTVNDTLNAGGTINLTISYLPNPNDEITIMHADTVLNQFDTVNIPAGWSVLYNYPNKGDISVKYDKTNLNVKAFLEGYYNGNSTMNTLLHNIGLTEDATAVDSIEVQMWSPDHFNLSEPTFSSKTILHNDGNANLSLPINMIGGNYYICIKHKNSIETWSAEPITISTINYYDFTISQDKAYNNNLNSPMKSMPDGNFAIYSGDNNQDGTIDIFDMMITENDAANLFFGYGFTDCNGDGATDILDMQIIENNSGLMIYYASPR